MKIINFFLLLSINLLVKAQESPVNGSSNPPSYFDFYYGYRPYVQHFYNQLNTTTFVDAGNPLQLIGIRGSEYLNETGIFQNFTYTQILPQPIHIQDTLKGKITGCLWGVGLGAILKSKIIDLHCYAGFNSGRIRMYKNELIRQKNPFFSPKVGIQPWIKLKKLTLTLIMEYEYDVSNTGWKRTYFSNKNKIAIAPLRQTGVTVELGISLNMANFGD
jgi:hypothetical protein